MSARKDRAVFKAIRDPLIRVGPHPDYKPEIHFYEERSKLFGVLILNGPRPEHLNEAWLSSLRGDLVELEDHATAKLRSMGDNRRAVFRF